MFEEIPFQHQGFFSHWRFFSQLLCNTFNPFSLENKGIRREVMSALMLKIRRELCKCSLQHIRSLAAPWQRWVLVTRFLSVTGIHLYYKDHWSVRAVMNTSGCIDFSGQKELKSQSDLFHENAVFSFLPWKTVSHSRRRVVCSPPQAHPSCATSPGPLQPCQPESVSLEWSHSESWIINRSEYNLPFMWSLSL